MRTLESLVGRVPLRYSGCSIRKLLCFSDHCFFMHRIKYSTREIIQVGRLVGAACIDVAATSRFPLYCDYPCFLDFYEQDSSPGSLKVSLLTILGWHSPEQ